jgi:ubiquinone/menaquinone biosynthesis C-methylase UbiE
MRRNDFTAEWIALSQLLELRPGDMVLDAQTDADALLPILATEVTERGTCVGMGFGQQALKDAMEQCEEYGMSEVEIVAAHPIHTPFRDARFHGVILRHTFGFPAIEPIADEMVRITRSGGKIIFRHTDWQIQLPHTSPEEEAMIEVLNSKCCKDGRDFFQRIQKLHPGVWRETRIDVFTVSSRESRSYRRYSYDWRTMLKEQLARSRRFDTRQILDLIERLENTRGSKVSADRYIILGVKS